MRYFLAVPVLAALVGLTACVEEQSCDMLFVQEARTMAYDAGELVLKDTNPNILFFCDRPVRVAGHMTHDAFIQLVTEGDNNFVTDPPNAAVSTTNPARSLSRDRISGSSEFIKDNIPSGNCPFSNSGETSSINPGHSSPLALRRSYSGAMLYQKPV